MTNREVINSRCKAVVNVAASLEKTLADNMRRQSKLGVQVRDLENEIAKTKDIRDSCVRYMNLSHIDFARDYWLAQVQKFNHRIHDCRVEVSGLAAEIRVLRNEKVVIGTVLGGLSDMLRAAHLNKAF